MAAELRQIISTALKSPTEFLDRVDGWRSRRRPPHAVVAVNRMNALAAVHETLDVPDCGVCEQTIAEVSIAVAGRLGGHHHHDGGPVLAGAL